MTRRPATLGAATLALLLIAGPPLQANFITWSYSWSRTPEQVQADSPGTGYISLTDESQPRTVVGDSDIVATNLRTHSTATTQNPDRFTNKNYTLTLLLQDAATGEQGSLEFNGQFNGTLTASSSNITNTFTGSVTQTIVLGTTLFTVTIGPFSPPGPPSSSNTGSIAAHAKVRVESIVAALPEPGTLTLAGLGAAVIGVAHWRRRRRGEVPLA